MKVLWLTNSSMMLQPTIESLEGVKISEDRVKALWLTCDSMGTQPLIEGLNAAPQVTENLIFRYKYENDYETKCLEACEVHSPDLVFFIGQGNGPFVANPYKMNLIRQKWPLINFVTDAGCPGWWPTLKAYKDYGCFTKTVSVDGSYEWPKGTVDLVTLTLEDPRRYQEKNTTPLAHRPVKLGFMGGYGAGERKDIIGALRKEGLITVCDNRSELWDTYDRYVDFMVTCQAVINFGRTGMNGIWFHIKNRVLETGLAKACLFEQSGSPIAKWFIEGQDYLTWNSIDDIKKLLETPAQEMERLAFNLYSSIRVHHSPKVWLDKVLALL